ncbi:hypothetical protein VP01_6708g2, partial [Puccinia sorghi]
QSIILITTQTTLELCFTAMKQQLCWTQALTMTLDAEWDLRLTFVNVVTPLLLFKLYTQCS